MLGLPYLEWSSLLILTSCALLDVLMILSIISSGVRLLLLPDYLVQFFSCKFHAFGGILQLCMRIKSRFFFNLLLSISFDRVIQMIQALRFVLIVLNTTNSERSMWRTRMSPQRVHEMVG
jgi:hypothetical protein